MEDSLNEKLKKCEWLLVCCINAFNNIPNQKIYDGEGGKTYDLAAEIENLIGLERCREIFINKFKIDE